MESLWTWLGVLWAQQSGRQPCPLVSGAQQGPPTPLTDMVQEQVSGALQQWRQQLLLSRGEAAEHVGLHCISVGRAPDAHSQPRHCLWGSQRGPGSFGEECQGPRAGPPDLVQDRGADSRWS